jgi:pyridoxamine 5'-phosphate oxidase
VTDMPDADVDEYFRSRSRKSQIGAAVSQQSRPLISREELEARVHKFSDEHPDEIPRPSCWRGFCIDPEQIEFWMAGENRLHNRFLFTRDGEGWKSTRLYP